MSAALPLALFPLRGRTPLYALLTIVFVAWLCMRFASAGHAPGAGNGIGYVLEASSLLIGAIGAMQMRGLARARELIGRRQMPDALWQQWLRACIVETSLIWAYLSAIMGALLASPASTMPWPGALALLSFCLSLGATGMLARHARLPKKFGFLLNTIGAALLLATLWIGVGQSVAWCVALPLPWLILLALSWPMLGTALLLDWHRPLSADRHAPLATARSGPLAAVCREARRYSRLGYKNTLGTAPPHASIRSRFGWTGNATVPIFIYLNSFSPLRWEQEPDLRHLLSLGVLCLMMSDALIVRDLHWRSMLMPGGWRSGRIATHIFTACIKIQYLMIVAAACIFMLAQRLFDRPIADAISQVASHALLLPEVALALSIGLVLRALGRPVIVLGSVCALLAAGWAYARYAVGYANLSHWPANGMLYAVLMLLAACAMVGVANRLWTPEKLLACGRR